MCSVFSLTVSKGWLLHLLHHTSASSRLMDNGVGDPATTLVVMGSVVGGRMCFGWGQEWLTQMADTVNCHMSLRLPSESLQLFPLGFTHRKAALCFWISFPLAKVDTNNLTGKMM